MTSKNIFVIENDNNVREVLEELFKHEGFTVSSATDGKNALEILEMTSPPHLFLLDLMMPVMNGWDFLRIKNANPILASIPVIVFSASDVFPKDMSIVDVLTKPIDMQTLLAKVLKHYKDTRHLRSV